MQNTIRFIFIIFSINNFAGYDFEHADCKIGFVKSAEEYLNVAAKATLKSRSFIPQDLIENRILLPGGLYYIYEVLHGDSFFKSCTVRSFIKVASSRVPLDDDKVIFKKEIKRTLPRITFKGSERCNKAIKETFIHIPNCKAVGFAREKK
jgi:hypothetical protein